MPTKATIKTRTLAIYLEWNVEVLCDSLKEIPRELHPNPASKRPFIYLFIYLFIHLFIYIIYFLCINTIHVIGDNLCGLPE